jgi:hypothetical protein
MTASHHEVSFPLVCTTLFVSFCPISVVNRRTIGWRSGVGGLGGVSDWRTSVP